MENLLNLSRLEELNCETNQVEDAATEFATRVLYEEQIQNPQLVRYNSIQKFIKIKNESQTSLYLKTNN